MTELTALEWSNFITAHPEAHVLQTGRWGELKASFGWDPVRVVVGNLGAQILFRALPLGFTLAYVPKGPIGWHTGQKPPEWQAFWTEVDAVCRSRRAVFLKLEPDLWLKPGHKLPGPKLPLARPFPFVASRHSIQPPRTILVDIKGSEDDLLARMKQKTRYNIRLALKKGVIVHASSDLEAFYKLMQVTGDRDAFGVHSLEYYRRAYELFSPRSECELLVAEYEGEVLAAILVFSRGQRAWYFYGASSNIHRERMPAYLVQWEGMRWARAQGCTEYDLWGVPDAEAEELEAGFENRSGGLWGVYRFKRGFGGELMRAQGPWDRVYHPGLYALYRWWTGRRATDAE